MLGFTALSEAPLSTLPAAGSSPDVTVSVTGQAITTAQGSVSGGQSVAGQFISFAAGTVLPATSVAETGQAITSATGTTTAASSVAIAGQSASFAAGTVTPSISVAGTGQVITATPGSVSVVGDVAVAATGQEIALSQGTLTASAVTTETAAITGGWIDPRALRKIQRQAKDYQRAVREERADREKRQSALFQTIEDTYARLTGEALPETPEEIAEIIEAPKAAPDRRVADAVAVYAAVARMGDATALDDAFEAMDRAILEARIAAQRREDDRRILELSDEFDVEMFEAIERSALLFGAIMKVTNAHIRL